MHNTALSNWQKMNAFPTVSKERIEKGLDFKKMLNKVKVEMLNKVFDILSFGFNFSLLISIISCRICVIHSLSKIKKKLYDSS